MYLLNVDELNHLVCARTLLQALKMKEFPSPTGCQNFSPKEGSNVELLMEKIKGYYETKQGVLTTWEQDDKAYCWNNQPELKAVLLKQQPGSAMVAGNKRCRIETIY